MNKPIISVLALGGTIAMTKGEAGHVVPTLTGEKLVAAVPELQEIAQIDAQSFRQLPSAHLKLDDLEQLADEIRTLARAGRAGIVITQGTDTIEETAFALDRLLELDLPIVVTGAMRNPTVPGADGPANLLAAVQVAASTAVHGCGCTVVMNDEIHAARFVRKTHTSRLDAFSSPACGRIGWISEGAVIVPLRPVPVPALPRVAAPAPARVARLTLSLGDDDRSVRALLAAGCDGLVVDATGGGHVPPEVADALGEAAAQLPVVLASRTGAGQTLTQTYGFSGSETDLLRRGLLSAGWLDGTKAKLLLTLVLRDRAATADHVAAAFAPWGGGRPAPRLDAQAPR